MNIWPFVLLIALVFVLVVVVIALVRKDTVLAAVWFRPGGFILAARNAKPEPKDK